MPNFMVTPNFMTIRPFQTIPSFMTVPQFQTIPNSLPFLTAVSAFPRSFAPNPFGFNTAFLVANAALNQTMVNGIVGRSQAFLVANAAMNQTMANGIALQSRAFMNAGLMPPFTFGFPMMSPFGGMGFGFPMVGSPFVPVGNPWFNPMLSTFPMTGTAAAMTSLPMMRTQVVPVPTLSAPMGSPQSAAGTEQAPALPAGGQPSPSVQLSWPLGLRILPPAPETQALRDEIDGLLQTAAAQKAKDGRVNPRVVQELNAAVGKLEGLLRKDDERRNLPLEVHNEAARFLKQLKDALKTLQ
jgi:hypothetical protein